MFHWIEVAELYEIIMCIIGFILFPNSERYSDILSGTNSELLLMTTIVNKYIINYILVMDNKYL